MSGGTLGRAIGIHTGEGHEGSTLGVHQSKVQPSSTCGTIAGYHAHRAANDIVCDPCAVAYGRVQALLEEGLTYRQLDYWVRKGYLKPDHPEWARQGTPREWSEREIEVARIMYRLTSAGLSVPVAAEVARGAVDEVLAGLTAYAELARGLWIGVARS